MNDRDREVVIDFLMELLTYPSIDRQTKRFIADKASELINERSEMQVVRMEKQKGLRAAQ